MMVAPYDFQFNPQTAVDNTFQKNLPLSSSDLRRRVLAEYHGMVRLLQRAGIMVVQLPRRRRGPATPDAVFPNNWLMVDALGRLVTFPMRAANRRLECRPRTAATVLLAHGFEVRQHVALHTIGAAGHALEGTGSMVIDHRLRRIFAALSERTQLPALKRFMRKLGYRDAITFTTRGPLGKAIYHTNVMLSIGDGFAVICPDCIGDKRQRRHVLGSLAQPTIIELSLSQCLDSFAANLLQLKSSRGNLVTVLSQRAYLSLNRRQRQQLERHGEVLPVPLSTIETIGGGSARCMMLEIFAPRHGT